MVTSALGLGLCYINRIQRKNSFAETVNYRFLVIKASEDNSNQYMNFMNMIFSAEKLVIFNFRSLKGLNDNNSPTLNDVLRCI